MSAARRAIAEFAGDLGLAQETADDLRTMVSEACANVVEHAYEHEPGAMELEAFLASGGLTVVVRDHGVGMRAHSASKPRSLRLGLALIGTLASSYEVSNPPGGGMELTMRISAAASAERQRA